MKKTIALVALILVAAASSAFAVAAAENWDNSCANCHGADGSGNTKIGKKYRLKDYTDAAVQAGLKDAEMFDAIKGGVKDENGKDRMKAFKDELSDAEVTDLVANIRKMKK
jgi:cytochrome c553